MMSIFKKIKLNNFTYIFMLLCFISGYIKNIIIIFSICLIHELGHVFFIKLFKYDILKIELFPFGGYTSINKKINSSINKEIIIALGGIIFQIIVLLVIFNFKDYINHITYQLIINYNFMIILFNLLPIIPLDGNKLIHLLLEKYFSYRKSYKLNFVISLFILIMFLIINIYFNIDNYFIIMFLVIQMFFYIKNYKYLFNKFLLERYLYDFEYRKISNNTKDICKLKKEVYHYFKNDDKYISEKKKLEDYFRFKGFKN